MLHQKISDKSHRRYLNKLVSFERNLFDFYFSNTLERYDGGHKNSNSFVNLAELQDN